MNTIIVNDFAYINGGAAQVAFDTAKLLATHGHRVILFSSVGSISEDIKHFSGIEIVCLNQQDILHDSNRIRASIQGIYNLTAAKAFRELLASFSPDNTIIHIHALQKAVSASIIPVANKMGFKILYHLHDYGVACPNLGFYNYQSKRICQYQAMSLACITCNCDRRSWLHKGWRVLRQYMQHVLGLPKHIDGFISISDFSLQILKRYLGNKPVYMLPNIIDVKKNECVDVKGKKAFLYVGRLSKEKGVTFFAEAAKKLQVPAIFVGAGECEDDIKRIYPGADMRGWLSHEEMESVWREALALVFPSLWYEGQGLTVCEALAHGLPVIVPTQCAASKSIIDGENGLIFTSGSVVSLIDKMKKIMENNFAQALSKNAYNYYWRKKWDENSYYASLMDIYHKTLNAEKQ